MNGLRIYLPAPEIDLAFSTRSRPSEIERGVRGGRVGAAVDWLVPTGDQVRQVTLFEDEIIAVARN